MATTFGGKTVMDKAPVEATEFIKERERIPRDVQTILLHTRYKTKGDVANSVNNHPVIYKTCFAIHNGGIRNDDDLFEEFKLTRNGEVDTEIIPALLDLNGMADTDAVKTTMEKLQGPMAIAAIDPVRNPGQLLLARGDSSPLMIYHTTDYIVWASTNIALREAWGKVFGTPPDHNKIGMMPEGKFWLVNGQDIVEDEFKVNRPFTNVRTIFNRGNGGRGGHNNRSQRRNSGNITSERPLPWVGHDSLFITEFSFQTKVKDFRKEHEENPLVRIWANRENYDDKTDFEDVIGALSWIPCICREMVLSTDTKWHSKYGNICLDCYEVIRLEYTDKADRADLQRGSEDSRSPDVHVHQLTDEDRESLYSWARVDAAMDSLIIAEIVEMTQLPYETVEYLHWRCSTASNPTDYSKSVRALKEDVDRIWTAVEKEMWEVHGNTLLGLDDDQQPDTQHVAFTVKKGQGVSELWYRCILHGEEYRAGDECSRCAAPKSEGTRCQCADCGDYYPRDQVFWDSKINNYVCHECDSWNADFGNYIAGGESSVGVDPTAYATPVPEPIPLSDRITRCEDCGAFKLRDKACRPCSSAEKGNEKTQKALEAGKPNCYCTTTKGNPCKLPVKFVVNGRGYCAGHFNRCNLRRCNKTAKHLLLDGTRVCHGHARNQKGSKSDRQLGIEGITIMEVR